MVLEHFSGPKEGIMWPSLDEKMPLHQRPRQIKLVLISRDVEKHCCLISESLQGRDVSVHRVLGSKKAVPDCVTTCLSLGHHSRRVSPN